MALILQPVAGIPMVKHGDDLCEFIHASTLQSAIDWQDGDIIVLAQKIVS